MNLIIMHLDRETNECSQLPKPKQPICGMCKHYKELAKLYPGMSPETIACSRFEPIDPQTPGAEGNE